MSAWTSEPWTIFPVDPNTVLRCTGGGNKVLAELEGCTMPDSLGGTPAANAARLVACVNGCAGLNPEKYGDVMEALQRCLILLGQVAFTDPKLETARRNEMDEGQAVYSAALRLAQEGT